MHRRQDVERPVDMRGVRQEALGQDEGDDAERDVDGEQHRATTQIVSSAAPIDGPAASEVATTVVLKPRPRPSMLRG